jgi:heavy metal translocating P-type ATPase
MTMEEQLNRGIGGVGERSTAAKLLNRLSDDQMLAIAAPYARFWRQLAMLLLPAFGIVAGFGLMATGRPYLSEWVWAIFTMPVLLVLFGQIAVSLWNREVGLDIIAALSMAAALGFREALAAVVVALMYAGGQFLEAFAERRSRGEMTALLARVPRKAMRHREGQLEEIPLNAIEPGDRLLIRRGDVVPVVGLVAAGMAVLDQSALTGEPLPVRLEAGAAVMSGSTNAAEAFDLVAAKPADESTYAGIVRLVEAAQRSRAPMSRAADRFAMLFLAMTVALAVLAWYFTNDPIRAVAVLVVATPCPLILAVPIAIVSGLSRAAKLGILIKGGKAIEALSRASSLVVDKTGTLTEGRARVTTIHVEGSVSEELLLQLAASLDQASKHVVAQTLVDEARRRGLNLAIPSHVAERPGEGVTGRIDGRDVAVGGFGFVISQLQPAPFAERRVPRQPGEIAVAVAIDGKLAGEIVLADALRGGMRSLLDELKGLGIERIVLATGDRAQVARRITAGLPIDAVRAELTPDQKVLVVLSERKSGPVMMVGDGVNDAPALAAADIGIALGARGAAASAEAADVVLLVDDLARLVPAIRIARRTRYIALQSVVVGLGLSVSAMVAAAFGYLSPVEGALLQEVIDVSVILNALRSLGDAAPSSR